MQLDWEKMFRRYVYDEERTPYFTPVNRLNTRQARYEIFPYALFMIILFSITGLAALSGKLPHGTLSGVPIYAFFTVWAALVFVWTRNQMAAAFCALAPVAMAIYFVLFGFPKQLGSFEKTLIGIFLVAWLYYSWRIVRIAAHYPEMPEATTPPRPMRRNPYDSLK